MSDHQLLINGVLGPSAYGATFDVVNPATGEVEGQAPDALEHEMGQAIAAARTAFDETDWSTNTELRVRVLRQFATALRRNEAELTDLTVAEVGAPRSACSTVQVKSPIEIVDWYADLLESYEWTTDLGQRDTLAGPARRWIEREAIGVVGAITPWNVPNQINLAKVIPALAAGCTVVLKPAPETPWTGLALGRFAAEFTDLPAGVLNVVTSSVPEFGQHLSSDPRVDMVSFTGSTATGRKVMASASAHLTKVFLELGGKSVSVVLDDVADMGTAAVHAAFGLATVAGQGCALTTRVLLPAKRYAEGVDTIAKMMGNVAVGDPNDPAVMMGPVISQRQMEKVHAYVQGAVAQGATIVCGGKPVPGTSGFFYEPTLLAGVRNDMTAAQEEIFGPVLVAIPYESDDEAVAIANDSIYGLSGAVFSDDPQRARSVGRRIRTGTMSINGGVWYGPDVPFGGYKQSGLGREMGLAGFEEHLEMKSFAEPV